MRLEEVFGVSNNELSTYVERTEVDDCFKNALKQNRQIIIYGSSKQGKTTLLNKHVENNKMIKIQCSPNMSLSDIYKIVIKQLKIKLESSSTNETHNDNKIKFNFMVQIPTLAKAGLEISKTKGQKESVTEIEIDINNAQSIAELIKEYFPEKIIILENFHYLNENIQRDFSYDLRTFQDIDVRIIILGIWRERNRLTQYNGDLQDRVIELPVEPWEKFHLQRIISLGELELNIDMSNIMQNIIQESFGNVGVLQELCRKSCVSANITGTGNKTRILNEHLEKAIKDSVNDYATRFNRSLETFADSKPRQSQDGSKGLGMPYFFVHVILSNFDVDQIKLGLSLNEIRNAIKTIHPNRDNRQFDGALTNFLNRISTYQKNNKINPSIFDYDSNSRKLNIVDPTFFFYKKHHDHNDFVKSLKLPEGFYREPKSE